MAAMRGYFHVHSMLPVHHIGASGCRCWQPGWGRPWTWRLNSLAYHLTVGPTFFALNVIRPFNNLLSTDDNWPFVYTASSWSTVPAHVMCRPLILSNYTKGSTGRIISEDTFINTKSSGEVLQAWTESCLLWIYNIYIYIDMTQPLSVSL